MTKVSVEERAPELDERTLVEAAQRGSQDALAALYEHYFPLVYRYVAARLGGDGPPDRRSGRHSASSDMSPIGFKRGIT